MRVFTDKLQKIKKEYSGNAVSDSFYDFDPVDAFGGFVAVDKYAADNLKKTNDNIAWKVGLEPNDPFIEIERKK